MARVSKVGSNPELDFRVTVNWEQQDLTINADSKAQIPIPNICRDFKKPSTRNRTVISLISIFKGITS